MKLRPCGELAVLVELTDLDEVMGFAGPVRAIPQVVDVVCGEATLLVSVADPRELAEVSDAITRAAPTTSSVVARTLEIPVTYDGDDLQEVAQQTGLTPAEVVEAHTRFPWRVAFGGFAPGFAYLVGGDPRLTVRRRDQPRPRVPNGAVGLAGRYSGIYPRASPGGWQLIGSTAVTLFDPQRTPPALLEPGSLVRFVDRDRRG